ncbi:2TM domain-containing protein [Tenacibaculum sp. IB213877]|uniref:2TM domain-containing protein n=1 Tax=Tenacibaculum sp. IB213877 TaxID=3097351 RepID=UPI002A5AFC44|nr:2TM domain-containing protein [Tenacibaculum sp. IB213877]MDY0779230.1 2TM domain-containing protein [Tenacibaculum sp. IB213877]
METQFVKEQQFLRAKKKVKEIKTFYTHLLAYVLTMPIVVTVNLIFVPQFHWFWFPVLGWATAILIHWFTVFGKNFIGLGKDWEERKIKELMQEENQRKIQFFNDKS